MTLLLALLLTVILYLVDGGVVLTREVKALAGDSDLYLLFDQGCKTTDAYGSNNCEWGWGSLISGSLTSELGHDLLPGSTVNLKFTVNRLIKWEFTCPACDANCTTTIPVVNQPVTFPLPPCPIQAFEVVDQLFNTTLPAQSPSPVKVTASGDIVIKDQTGATVIDLYLDMTVQ